MLALVIYTILLISLVEKYILFRLMNVNGIEYGLGIGPKLIKFNLGKDIIRLNLLPLGDYAKIPLSNVSDDERCKSVLPKLTIIASSVNLASFIILALATCYLLSYDPFTVVSSILREFSSGLGFGNGVVSIEEAVYSNFIVTFCYSIFAIAIINSIPLAGTPMGSILAIALPSIYKNNIFELISLLTLFVVIIIAFISIIW